MIKQSIEILIPCHNEEGNIEIVTRKSLAWLSQNTKDYRVLIVDDGSTDGTSKVLMKLSSNPYIKIITHETNLGIGMAFKTLYQNSIADFSFTCPADQQFNPHEFSTALKHMKKVDIISFYRTKKDDYGYFRHFVSFGNKVFNRIFFGLKLKDVNWVKCYKKGILKELDIQSTSSFLETEILAKAKKRGKIIIELPSNHYKRLHGESEGSSKRNLWKVLKDLIKVYKIVKNY